MSHTTTMDADFKDLDCLSAAVDSVGGRYSGASAIRLFDGTRVDAEASFTLPDWKYPVAVKEGKLYFDNYNGAWGKLQTLERVKQAYGRNVTVKTMRARGMRVTETVVNGHIRVRCER